jgi:hypothetical protein
VRALAVAGLALLGAMALGGCASSVRIPSNGSDAGGAQATSTASIMVTPAAGPARSAPVPSASPETATAGASGGPTDALERELDVIEAELDQMDMPGDSDLVDITGP